MGTPPPIKPLAPSQGEDRPRLAGDPKIDQFEYEVACLAWEKGKAENSILEALKMKKSPENYTRIRRALQKAVRHGLLELKPPRNTQLERGLVSNFPSLDKDHVHVEVDRAAACWTAARLVATEIQDFLYRSDKSEMVIANAGTSLHDGDQVTPVVADDSSQPGTH